MTRPIKVITLHVRTALALLGFVALVACEFLDIAAATDQPIWAIDVRGHDPLPKPTADVQFSPYEPKSPYSKFVKGMLTRTIARTTVGGGVIEIRDLLVGPNQNTEEARLPSTAVFTVLSGRGVLQIAEGAGQPKRKIDIKPGSTAIINPGQAFSVSNRTDSQIDIRVRLFAAQ